MTLCAFVKGEYAEAVQHYARIGPSYDKLEELDDLIVQGYLHQRRYADAVRFARDRELPKNARERVEDLARKPLRVTLRKATVIPFANHQLAPFFPAFVGEGINLIHRQYRCLAYHFRIR